MYWTGLDLRITAVAVIRGAKSIARFGRVLQEFFLYIQILGDRSRIIIMKIVEVCHKCDWSCGQHFASSLTQPFEAGFVFRLSRKVSKSETTPLEICLNGSHRHTDVLYIGDLNTVVVVIGDTWLGLGQQNSSQGSMPPLLERLSIAFNTVINGDFWSNTDLCYPEQCWQNHKVRIGEMIQVECVGCKGSPFSHITHWRSMSNEWQVLPL